MKKFERVLLVCGLSAIAVPAWAGTATTTFGVSGTVVPTCSVSAAPMSFGATIPGSISANVDATTTITATCATGSSYSVSLNAGLGAGATFATRRMTSGANTLAYSLFLDSGRTDVWGDGVAGTTAGAAFFTTGTGGAQALTVFGRIPAPQTIPTGLYSDTITVTVTF